MNEGRYVVLGLAHHRAPWFVDVTRWSTSGMAPVEFVKCLSVSEVAARLESTRRYSAALVGAAVVGVDRDLLELARRADCPVIVVGGDSAHWNALGATAVLPAAFDRAALLDALATHGRLVARAEITTVAAVPRVAESPWRGRLVAVLGGGGVGASTVAMALAQGLADDVRDAGLILLADLARHADLAMYHDVGDVVPGLQELVEAHRHGRPSAAEVRRHTFDIAARRYHLLLGLRRHRDWTALKPRAFETALDSARAAFHVVVADLDHDLEGEAETGSADVEDRNLMARTVVMQADVVVVVSATGVKGAFTAERLVRDLVALGAERPRLVVVVNRSPRSARARREEADALVELLGESATSTPIALGERRNLEHHHRAADRLPSAITTPIAHTVRALLDRTEPRTSAAASPELVTPGSLWSWSGQESAS